MEARFTRRGSQAHRYRRPRRAGQSVERSMAARGAPALLGAQAAQPAKPTQSLPASMFARSKTHLPGRERAGSDRARFRKWKRRWEKDAPRAVHCLEADLEELFSIFRLPPVQRRRLRTTNVIERLFVEVRRRIRTMCAFTTRDSCERILYSVFYRMNQYWAKHPLKSFTQNS